MFWAIFRIGLYQKSRLFLPEFRQKWAEPLFTLSPAVSHARNSIFSNAFPVFDVTWAFYHGTELSRWFCSGTISDELSWSFMGCFIDVNVMETDPNLSSSSSLERTLIHPVFLSCSNLSENCASRLTGGLENIPWQNITVIRASLRPKHYLISDHRGNQKNLKSINCREMARLNSELAEFCFTSLKETKGQVRQNWKKFGTLEVISATTTVWWHITRLPFGSYQGPTINLERGSQSDKRRRPGFFPAVLRYSDYDEPQFYRWVVTSLKMCLSMCHVMLTNLLFLQKYSADRKSRSEWILSEAIEGWENEKKWSVSTFSC